MRFSVCVNQGSTFVLRTMFGAARGAKAAADAGSSCIGIAVCGVSAVRLADDVSDAMLDSKWTKRRKQLNGIRRNMSQRQVAKNRK